ncbi:MAG: EAL and modified HD-GYP domain-containing signal transduction protein [Alphaproteobacteria bacterium]
MSFFYVARQPILDKNKNLFAYELLFRDGLENSFPEGTNDNEATAKVIVGLEFNLGLESLTQGSLAFINFTHDTLIDGYPLLMDKEQIVVEILETAKPSKRLLAICIDLKKKGYTIALDDYEHGPRWVHFFPYVDILKLDYPFKFEQHLQEIIPALKPYPHIKLLAEKIETYADYKHALSIGCEYFQGYFFSRPEIVKTVAFNPSQVTVVNLSHEINKDEFDIQKITSIFEGDVMLSYKLLRYVKSPIFKRVADIKTIKQAILVLGIEELKRFIGVMFTAQFSIGKPRELTVMALFRGHFCELMAKATLPGHSQSSAFLMGLLSLIDAMVDGHIEELIEKLPIHKDIKDAIINRKGESAKFLVLCEFFEKGDWPNIELFCQQTGVSPENVCSLFQQSLNWADDRITAIQ